MAFITISFCKCYITIGYQYITIGEPTAIIGTAKAKTGYQSFTNTDTTHTIRKPTAIIVRLSNVLARIQYEIENFFDVEIQSFDFE